MLQALKPIRVALAVLVLAASVAVFLDLRAVVSPHVATFLLPLQFIPSILKSLAAVGLWTAGLAFVVVLTLLTGRVYCSTFCPLGTLQDIAIHIADRRRKRRYRHDRPRYVLHYALTAASIAAFAGGSLVLLDLLEPFSNFGRMMDALVRPVAVGLHNALAFGGGLVGVHVIQPVPFFGPGAGVLIAALAGLGTIGYMSYRHGRLFCNTLCPAGALLGLLSRVSLLRLVIDRETCLECGLCEKVCKAACIDADRKAIDHAACVMCFNCISACPTVGLRFAGVRINGRVAGPEAGKSRRRFMSGGMSAALGAVILPADSAMIRAAQAGIGTRPVTPPGSVGIKHFSSHCTACHLCVSACPTGVLRPSLLDYGIAGFLQPRMDFRTGSCTYDCVLCSTMCPSGAILPLTPDRKKEIQAGTARFVKEDCIVETKKKDCSACSEHCPTKAVYMVPYGALMLPELNNELCVGCGACEHACPTIPRKAIFVISSEEHGRAKKPVIEKKKPAEEVLTEFPF